jgi:2-isopropylmalate synthase
MAFLFGQDFHCKDSVLIMRIFTFDTTLRDGTQGESVSFSAEDKLLIAEKLDELGIDYIEGGWPGSNPKDKEFFERARKLKLQHAKLTAFGATRLAKNSVEADENVRALIAAQTPVVSIFGKTWDFHVRRALGITEQENLTLIYDTVAYLKAHGREVVYDAEHFFDGYFANPSYAFRTLESAKKAGADVLCLCDTNGGTLPSRLAALVAEVVKEFGGTIGIHTHNDCELAVANTLAAVDAVTPISALYSPIWKLRWATLPSDPKALRSSPARPASWLNWLICNCAATRLMSAPAPSRIRAVFTSAP